MKLTVALSLAVLLLGTVRAEEKILCDFENDADKTIFDMKTGTLSDQHVTHGQKSLKIMPGEYMTSWRLPKDWSGFDSLDIDAFVDGDVPVNGTVLVGDVPWKEKGSTYWNRHNGTFNLKPGANVISISVNGLFRGEAGSRGNDLHTPIDPKQILRVDLGFSAAGKVNAIYLDYVRLVKESRPEGIQAYSFGPESHTVFPGFTSISWNTVYGQNGSKAGFRQNCANPNRARDDTFPTRLYQNFVWFQENGNEFICDVPNGKVHGWLVFDDCGYWGGEQAHFHKRTVSANGKIVYTDDRGELGPADYLLRFEKVEPKPGDSLWDLYMKDLFKPVRFEADVADGKLKIHCEADAAWSSKVASIIVFPDSIKNDGEKWVAEVEARNKKEFDSRAVFMGPKPKTLDIPEAAKTAGYWLGFPGLEETITFVDAPGTSNGKLQRPAAKGQRLGFTFAVRPLKDFNSAVTFTATDLKGPGGSIPASALDLRYVLHLTQRGFNDIAYTIMPMSMRHVEGSGLKLSKDLTRQFWITATVPADAKPGVYSGEVALSAGELNVKLPLSIEVLDLTLDEPDFAFGFFGAWVPGEFNAARQKRDWNDLFSLMKQIGMTSIDGGPMVNFSGLDEAGKPKLDFAACDEFYKTVKQAGFTKPLYRYGGLLTGLYDGYTIGQTGHDWEKKTGKPMTELLKIVWTAIQEHADKEGWPVLYYGMLDEPRALDPAKENLEFHKAYRNGAPFVKVGGFYSVNWKNNDPLDATIQEIFKTMYWSGLNGHNQTDLDKGKEFGREVHIYNQGLDRYSFGAYQWAEMRKGVKGRMQWFTLALQGYQFFDLDAREPDPGILNWGKDGIIPTLHCEHACEGANDFKYAATLWNLAQKKKDSADAKAALEFLEEVNRKIVAGQNTRPEGFMSDDAFREQCIKFLKALK
jgi:hypothetical protein